MSCEISTDMRIEFTEVPAEVTSATHGRIQFGTKCTCTYRLNYGWEYIAWLVTDDELLIRITIHKLHRNKVVFQVEEGGEFIFDNELASDTIKWREVFLLDAMPSGDVDLVEQSAASMSRVGPVSSKGAKTPAAEGSSSDDDEDGTNNLRPDTRNGTFRW